MIHLIKRSLLAAARSHAAQKQAATKTKFEATSFMFKHLLLILVAISAPVFAQAILTPVTIADVAGDGAVHSIGSLLSAANATARSITILASPANVTTTCGSSAISGCPRTGDSNISTTQGFYIQPGLGAYYQESSSVVRYALNTIYFLVQPGDKITIIYTP